MRGPFLLRLVGALAIAGALCWSLYRSSSLEGKRSPEGLPRYRAIIAPYLYPLFLSLIVLPSLLVLGPRETLMESFRLCFDVLLLLTLYVPLLLLLLPLLRRRISPRACALLWLIPNFLYLVQGRNMALDRPLWVLRAPLPFVEGLVALWALGFVLVLAWEILRHLRFRHALLKASQPVTEPELLALWHKAYQEARFPKKAFPLLRCPALKTPLSIGFFHWNTYVLLPARDYSPEDLELIFRHELIHIGRQDSATKFFLAFCSALCWFNPLLRLASRNSADDLELSCDESVLQGADPETRRRYAALLLGCAGDDRGFSSCLSASAKGLRYRLENVLSPHRRWLGGIAIGLATLGLLLSCGSVAWAYDQEKAGELLFHEPLENYEPGSFTLWEGQNSAGKDLVCGDKAAFQAQLAQLSQWELLELTGSYSFPPEGRELSFLLHGQEESLYLTLQEEPSLEGALLEVTFLREEDIHGQSYLLAAPLPWEELLALLEPAPEPEPEPPSYPPELGLYFSQEVNGDAGLLYCSKEVSGKKIDGVAQPIYYPLPEDVGGISGYKVEQVELHFEGQLCPEGYSVSVMNWDCSQQDLLYSEDLEDPLLLPLAPYDAHYMIFAKLLDEQGVEYEMVYRFDVQF